MASATLPHHRTGTHRGRWLAGGIALLVFVVIIAVLLSTHQRGAVSQAATVPVTRGGIVASVAGIGSIAAAQALDLPFQTSGRVAEVLVAEGDSVSAGQVLARL